MANATNIGTAKRPVPFDGVSKPKDPSRMYTAELIANLRGGGRIELTAPLPENYQFQLSTSFDNPFNQPMSNMGAAFGNGVGQAVDTASTGRTYATGKTTVNKWMSGGVWTGGSMFEITVPFVIQAYESTKEEVVKLMRDMLKLVAPSESEKGFLIAPGPNLGSAFDTANAGDDISIRIGQFFVMRPCIIESVTCDFDTQMDEEEHCPLSATITVHAKSFWATTKEDLDGYFQL